MHIAGRLLGIAMSLCAASLVIAAGTPVDGDGIDPRYLLMDGKGRGVTSASFPDRFQLLSFGYAASADIGPTTLAEMAEVMQRLGERAARVQPVFISVDPARDLPSRLQGFVDHFDSRIIALSGTEALTTRVVNNYKLHVNIVRAPDAAPDDYTVEHSTGMLLLDPNGEFVRAFPFGTPVAEITTALEALIEPAPTLDAR